jgi:hypothetical protein
MRRTSRITRGISSPNRLLRFGRSKRAAAAVVLAGGLAPLATGALVASAAVPAFPDNLVVFPDRDFITVEGFQSRIGETALLEVTRAGQVIGSAKAVVQEGDVAFEVNHPGGACWGAGTDLNVTPDIRPGDQARISFAGEAAGDMSVQDSYVTGVNYQDGQTTFAVVGHVGGGITQAQMEQRIVNPALTETAVGRRDVRAVPGGLVRAPKGGYSSNLEFSGDAFTATYVFDDPEVARIAATGGGERIMAWQEEDVDGNRQGLTISEFGELGGPGMGGCPAGPTDQAAPRPGTAAVVRSEDKRSVKVTWTPATAQPGAAPVTGYSVVAVADTASAFGEQTQVGVRTGTPSTSTTITNLDPAESYDVEVRSLAGARMSEAFAVSVPGGTSGEPTGDLVPPTVTVSPTADAGAVAETKTVTLTADEAVDIYYTTDGSPALDNGDLPSDSAKLYTGPIAITTQTEITFAAFDKAGNFALGSGTFAPPSQLDPVPNAPTFGNSTAGDGTVTLRWSATDPTITGYAVQLYANADGSTVGGLRETTATSMTINGLAAGSYSFTVKAKNATGYGLESTQSAPLTVTPVTDKITIGTARWKAGDFRVTGTGDSVGATVTIRSGSKDGPSLGSGRVTAAPAPAVGGVYDLRFRDAAAPATRPATIYVVSSLGGVAGPFTVAQG